MLRKMSIPFIVAAMVPCSVSIATDWNVTKDRVLFDQVLEKVSEQCSQWGFTRVAPSEGAPMEKRIFAHLLLLDPAEAEIKFDLWASYYLKMMDLLDPDRLDATGKIAGDALTAAIVDPSSEPYARKRYIAAAIDHARPFFEACANMTSDPFLAANYLADTGSLSIVEREASTAFDVALKATVPETK